MKIVDQYPFRQRGAISQTASPGFPVTRTGVVRSAEVSLGISGSTPTVVGIYRNNTDCLSRISLAGRVTIVAMDHVVDPTDTLSVRVERAGIRAANLTITVKVDTVENVGSLLRPRWWFQVA